MLYVVPATYGAMDLGGASTQMTFISQHPSASPEDSREHLVMYGTEYDVYTHSYLCYGINEAHRQYLAHLVIVSSP